MFIKDGAIARGNLFQLSAFMACLFFRFVSQDERKSKNTSRLKKKVLDETRHGQKFLVQNFPGFNRNDFETRGEKKYRFECQSSALI